MSLSAMKGFQPNTLPGDKRCAICLCDDIGNGDNIAQMESCIHIFCIECIMEWLDHSSTCPACRTPALELHYGTPTSGEKTRVKVRGLTTEKFYRVLGEAEGFIVTHVCFSGWVEWFLKLGSWELHKGFRSPVEFKVELSVPQMRRLYDRFYNGTDLLGRLIPVGRDSEHVKDNPDGNLRRVVEFAEMQLQTDIIVIDRKSLGYSPFVYTVTDSYNTDISRGRVGRNSQFYTT